VFFTFLILFIRPKTGSKRESAAPNDRNSNKTKEYFVRIEPRA
jgi:hypothetical protein